MIIQIERADDPRVEAFCRVRESDLVKRRGMFLAESVEVVRTLALRSKFGIHALFVLDRKVGAIADVLGTLPEETPVYTARSEVMNEVIGFDFHRGCIALGSREEAPGLSEVLDGLGGGSSLVVVLEGLANHDNIGGVFRNAACFGADAVLLDPSCGDPLYRKSIRTSIGGTLTVPFGRLRTWPDALQALAARGFVTYALTPDTRAESLDEVIGDRAGLPPRRALILGTEGAGLTEQTLAAAGVWLRIPMADGVDSLNVGTASGIALWAMRKTGR